MPVTVLQATAAHLDRAAPLFADYRAFYGKPRDVAAARAFLAARLAARESVVFLAEAQQKDGTVKDVGFMQLYPTYSSLSLKPYWILNDLFVAPDARRQGVAQALLAQATAHARATGAAGLSLQTAKDNHPAQALYEREGWTRDGHFLTYVRGP